MNLQEIHDKISERARDQRRGALRDFIGVLIKDEHYNVSFVLFRCTHPRVQGALKKSGLPADGTTMAYLEEAQATHDVFEPKEWAKRLKALGDEFGLETKPAKEANFLLKPRGGRPF